MKPIKVTQQVWEETWFGLRARGMGKSEAACIWSGKRSPSGDIVHSVIFLDDLPGVHAGARYHRLSRLTIEALFKLLRDRHEMIVADIHTHPSDWVDLSPTDREHPIEFRRGLPAMIVPNFAKLAPSLNGLGLHEYVGDGAWRRLGPEEIRQILKIGV
jgi:hypothetical protein